MRQYPSFLNFKRYLELAKWVHVVHRNKTPCLHSHFACFCLCCLQQTEKLSRNGFPPEHKNQRVERSGVCR